MISRLTTIAALFSVLATASITFAAGSHQPAAATTSGAKQVRIVQLQPVVITAKRLDQTEK